MVISHFDESFGLIIFASLKSAGFNKSLILYFTYFLGRLILRNNKVVDFMKRVSI